MTDSELIAEARARWRDDPLAGPLLLALAARLGQLTAPAGRSPLTPGREAEMRGRLPTFDQALWGEKSLAGWCRDLLAALDWERDRRVHAEGVIQDMCAESARHEAGVREGVARALAALWQLLAQADADVKRVGEPDAIRRMWGDRWNALSSAISVIEAECGPALLPQHAVTHARMVRLEAALAEIVAKADALEPPGGLWRIASEALGGEP